MRFRTSRGGGWLYLLLVLIAALCLYLFGWPIVRRVVLHRGEEAFEETVRPEESASPTSRNPERTPLDEP